VGSQGAPKKSDPPWLALTAPLAGPDRGGNLPPTGQNSRHTLIMVCSPRN